MTAGRRDLEGELGVGLTDDLAEVAHGLGLGRRDDGHRHVVDRAPPADGVVAPNELGHLGHGVHPDPRHQPCLAGVGHRHDDVPHTSQGRRVHEGQDAGHRTDRTVETHLADVDDVAHHRPRQEVHRRRDRDEDAEVEAGADLALPRR